MRIAIDAMGGDYAPDEIIAGALQGREVLGPDDEIVLVGDETVIRETLTALKASADTFRIFHTPDMITKNESQIKALRRKPKSSIAVMAHAAIATAKWTLSSRPAIRGPVWRPVKFACAHCRVSRVPVLRLFCRRTAGRLPFATSEPILPANPFICSSMRL